MKALCPRPRPQVLGSRPPRDHPNPPLGTRLPATCWRAALRVQPSVRSASAVLVFSSLLQVPERMTKVAFGIHLACGREFGDGDGGLCVRVVAALGHGRGVRNSLRGVWSLEGAELKFDAASFGARREDGSLSAARGKEQRSIMAMGTERNVVHISHSLVYCLLFSVASPKHRVLIAIPRYPTTPNTVRASRLWRCCVACITSSLIGIFRERIDDPNRGTVVFISRGDKPATSTSKSAAGLRVQRPQSSVSADLCDTPNTAHPDDPRARVIDAQGFKC